MTFWNIASVVLALIGTFSVGLVLGFVVGVGWTHANFPQGAASDGPRLEPELWTPERVQNAMGNADIRRATNQPRPYKGPSDTAKPPRIAGLED